MRTVRARYGKLQHLATGFRVHEAHCAPARIDSPDSFHPHGRIESSIFSCRSETRSSGERISIQINGVTVGGREKCGIGWNDLYVRNAMTAIGDANPDLCQCP